MTLLLDIAALSLLVLVLSFVPALGIRADARITRQLRDAVAARTALEDAEAAVRLTYRQAA